MGIWLEFIFKRPVKIIANKLERAIVKELSIEKGSVLVK
jgi:hypothetical protein